MTYTFLQQSVPRLHKYIISALSVCVVGIVALTTLNAYATPTKDTLTSPHQISTFKYNYVNTSGEAAPGYFIISMEDLLNGNTGDYLELVQIREAYPVDTSGNPVSGATDRLIPVDDASFVNSQGDLTIILTPQHTGNGGCVPNPAGGCTFDLNGNDGWNPDTQTLIGDNNDGFLDEDGTDAMIPYDVRGMIEIQAAVRTSAPTTQAIILDQGGVKFPNGYTVETAEWRVTTNHAPSDSVLDPNSSVTGDIRGPGGAGNPVEGNPYTVVFEGMTGTNGDPLNAPNGTCSTEVNGTTYTGTGITNGRCVVDISVNASGTVPGGVGTVSDGGSPRAIDKENMSFAPKIAEGTEARELAQEDMANLGTLTNLSCDPASPLPGTTTTCSGTLPANVTPPIDNISLNVEGQDPVLCTFDSTGAGATFSCTGMAVGDTPGGYPIQAAFGSNDPENTGRTITVTVLEVPELPRTGGIILAAVPIVAIMSTIGYAIYRRTVKKKLTDKDVTI